MQRPAPQVILKRELIAQPHSRVIITTAHHAKDVVLCINAVHPWQVILEYELFVQPHSGNKGGGGGGGGRRASAQDRAKFHVLLTSYEMLALEAGPLGRGMQYGVLIVDEVGNILLSMCI